MISQSKIEEILEAVWVAEEKDEPNLEAVRRLCPDEIFAGEMEQLEAEGLLHLHDGRISFSERGKELARGVIRRHRLTECLLTTVLQVPATKAHEIACEMEHSLPPEMTQSICTLLGHPELTPDGMPIPSGPDCLRKQRSTEAVVVCLTELAPGQQGRIAYIRPRYHERSHQLASFGVVPGVTLELHQKVPAYCIRYEGTELALDQSVAADIFVSRPGGDE
jgi:DtxR family transcriptional regulator, Mn-dependent transcriptional regulator